MHPDDTRLAAYLDLPPVSEEYTTLRAHVLVCPRCAAHVARLREDARHVTASLGSHAPDVRAAVLARTNPRRRWAWLASGGWLAGAITGVMLFAALLGVQSGALGFVPDRVVVADRAGSRMVVLDGADGRELGTARVGGQPSSVVFDARRERVYVRTDRGITALDSQTLQVTDGWSLPSNDLRAPMALDARRGRLFVTSENGVTLLGLDGGVFAERQRGIFGVAIGALSLSPNGEVLFALSADSTTLWQLDTANGSVASRVLSDTPRQTPGALAPSRDGTALFVLLGTALGGAPPEIWRLDVVNGGAEQRAIAMQPPPWDLVVLDARRLALARGDGERGGVELLDADSLETITALAPDADEHQLVAGPRDTLFALNWLRGTVTRFDAERRDRVWQTEAANWQPWDAVLVPGGWRLR